MNIFEYLGLATDHRKLSNKVTQLVKHWDEVVEKNKTGKTFGIQIKKDGVCTLTVILDGEVSIWSRTGNRFTNTEQLCAKIEMLGMRDGVYMGEMTCPRVSLEVLSGAVNTNRIKPLTEDLATLPYELQMNWFDIISIKSFIKGSSQTDFVRRFNILKERTDIAFARFGGSHPDIHILPYVTVTTEEEIDTLLAGFVAQGEEGLVIRDVEADWEAGHKGYRVMKKVRGVDYDLRCIGFEEGTGKYTGKVANLIFNWKNGKTIKCMLGKGWTHQMAEDMLDRINYGESVGMQHYANKDSPVGKIFQVYALEESSQGKLRLPKVGEMRFDKECPDV